MSRKKWVVTALLVSLVVSSVFLGRALHFSHKPSVQKRDAARSLGSIKSPLWIVEYMDFQCGACAGASALIKQYQAAHPSKIYYQVKNYPLINSHPHALKSAVYADCAARQGKYWQMHDALFADQNRWSSATEPDVFFKELAAKAGLRMPELAVCVEDMTVQDAVLAEREEAMKLGANGTPAFFVNGKMAMGTGPLAKELDDYFGQKSPDLPAPPPLPKPLEPSLPKPYIEQQAVGRSLGDPKSPIKVVEYTDFQCPACAGASGVIKQILASHPSQIYYQVKNFPLTQIHPHAVKSAAYAECAARQGKFWPMHDALFADQQRWSASAEPDAIFMELAGKAGLETQTLIACLQDPAVNEMVLAEGAEAQSMGAGGTPAFFVNGKLIMGAGQLHKELHEHMDQKSHGPAAPLSPAKISTAQQGVVRALGDPKSPLKIVEYMDFQCPMCGGASGLIKQAQAAHPSKIYYQVKNFPLTQIHPHAVKSAVYAECAARQGKYWQMHDALFADQQRWSASTEPDIFLIELAGKAGLDMQALGACLQDPAVKEIIMAEGVEAQQRGVGGTPAFFVNDKLAMGTGQLQKELNDYFGEKSEGKS